MGGRLRDETVPACGATDTTTVRVMCAVFLAMVRVGQCELCSGQFIIEDELPKYCPHCGTRIWLYGIKSRESALIRQGRSFVSTTKNRGVTSAKRKAWGDKQWRQFKPKPDS
jgi:hypothetical protein